MSEDISTAVGSEVLFEDEYVRVWQMVLGPGESFPVHKHLHDHVLIHPEPGKIRGHIAGVDQVAVQEVDAGWVFFRAVGPDGIPPQRVENVGNQPSRHFIVAHVPIGQLTVAHVRGWMKDMTALQGTGVISAKTVNNARAALSGAPATPTGKDYCPRTLAATSRRCQSNTANSTTCAS